MRKSHFDPNELEGTCARSIYDRFYLGVSLTFFVLLVIGIVGVASPAWRSGHYGSGQWVDVGLIIRCNHDVGLSYHRCAPFDMGFQNEWFEVSRIFCCVSMTFLFGLVVGSAFLHFADKNKDDYIYLLAASTFTGIIGVIGALVYAVESRDVLANSQTDLDLSWGWAVFMAAVLSVIALSFLLICWVGDRKRKPKLKQVTPYRG